MGVLWFAGVILLKLNLEAKYSAVLLADILRYGQGLEQGDYLNICDQINAGSGSGAETRLQAELLEQAESKWQRYADVPMVYSALLVSVCLVWQWAGNSQQQAIEHPKLLAGLCFLGQLVPLLMICISLWRGQQTLTEPFTIDWSILGQSIDYANPGCLDGTRLCVPSGLSSICYQLILAAQVVLGAWYLLICGSKLVSNFELAEAEQFDDLPPQQPQPLEPRFRGLAAAAA